MIKFKEFLLETKNDKSQELLNKLYKELEDMSNEKEISILKSKIENLQNKLSNY